MAEEHPTFKLGRREPKNAPALIFDAFWTGQIPAHPKADDHLSKVSSWCLGANNRFGTCGPTYVANDAVQVWKYLLGEDIIVSDEAVFKLYKTQNPDFDPSTDAGDNGVDLQSLLEALLKVGLDITHADGSVENVKPLAFAKIASDDIDEVRAATAIFGGVGFGLDLEEAQQAQTQAGGPWDYSPSPVWGGHATYGGSYTSDSGPHQVDESLITWKLRVGTTDQFMAHQLSERWLIIWPAHLGSRAFDDGVDKPALALAYKDLTGKDFPAPLNPPNPSPNPNPKPPGWEQELAGLLQRLQKALQDLEHFLGR